MTDCYFQPCITYTYGWEADILNSYQDSRAFHIKNAVYLLILHVLYTCIAGQHVLYMYILHYTLSHVSTCQLDNF